MECAILDHMRDSSSKAVTEKATKEALEKALESVEGVRMTRRDDPKLKALKNGLRGALRKIQKRTTA
jgi:hypothetical protein